MSRSKLWKPPETVTEAFAIQLRNLREDHDYKQWQVAQYLKIDRSTYAYYELGRRQPSYDIVVKLAKYYGVSVDYLLGENEKAGSLFELPAYIFSGCPE